jgi:hypothetical protein
VLRHGVFRRAEKIYGLPRNPVAGIEHHPQRSSGDVEVFSVEEVHALARAAASEQDGSRRHPNHHEKRQSYLTRQCD